MIIRIDDWKIEKTLFLLSQNIMEKQNFRLKDWNFKNKNTLSAIQNTLFLFEFVLK